MTALDGELGRVFDNGDELELGNGYNFKRPLKAERNAATQSIDIRMVAQPGTGVAHVIAAGVVTLSSSAPDAIVDTEGATASDDLVTLNPHADMGVGAVVILRSWVNARDTVLKHGTGNLKLTSGADFTLTLATSRIALMWSGAYWRELWRET